MMLAVSCENISTTTTTNLWERKLLGGAYDGVGTIVVNAVINYSIFSPIRKEAEAADINGTDDGRRLFLGRQEDIVVYSGKIEFNPGFFSTFPLQSSFEGIVTPAVSLQCVYANVD